MRSYTSLVSPVYTTITIQISALVSLLIIIPWVHFSTRQMRNVEEYIDSRIGRRSSMSFVNSRIDGTIAPDDHTTFYIKKYPGRLEIKLDKDKNSDEAYQGIKSMCNGIKKLLTK